MSHNHRIRKYKDIQADFARLDKMTMAELVKEAGPGIDGNTKTDFVLSIIERKYYMEAQRIIQIVKLNLDDQENN